MSIVWSKKGIFFAASILTLGLLFGMLLFVIEKPVTIAVDGQLIKTRALFTRTVGDVLNQNQIKLEGKDVVSPAQDTKVKKNLQITGNQSICRQGSGGWSQPGDIYHPGQQPRSRGPGGNYPGRKGHHKNFAR